MGLPAAKGCRTPGGVAVVHAARKRNLDYRGRIAEAVGREAHGLSNSPWYRAPPAIISTSDLLDQLQDATSREQRDDPIGDFRQRVALGVQHVVLRRTVDERKE